MYLLKQAIASELLNKPVYSLAKISKILQKPSIAPLASKLKAIPVSWFPFISICDQSKHRGLLGAGKVGRCESSRYGMQGKSFMFLSRHLGPTGPVFTPFRFAHSRTSAPDCCLGLPPGSDTFSLCSSMFSQQSPPHFGQQANTSMYNNNMNINVSMATNTGGLSNMNQMTGQISMTSVTSVPTSGLSSMGPEQVSATEKNF